MSDLETVAARALACLDLTNLNDTCTEADIDALCAKAQTPHGPTAAICIWPAFVAQARAKLSGTGIRIATVVNFPGGSEDAAIVAEMVRKAVDDGADEIDMVIDYRALKGGAEAPVTDGVKAVISAARPARVKAILETGELQDPALIRRAAELALAAGADFIKTSTGKVPVNATPEAAEIMLEAIRDTGANAGFKPAGGVKSTADAGIYLGLADRIMGTGWATPETFRFGASGVLDALLATLDGADAPEAGEGY
ncbi:deoxyribose-phosphate aldolase [Oceanomicrobium pacificus]|uniref:Deoxyribose-phosphate aldolase n=1 Tax=Oceanomicrobium pacificus TaxID=2692916 RepID=A0A6B0TNJ0_9RHOB|nr:deoxyribose-phosphate aldolase [Oceanomicrobium pacificus]MXU66117.1 deoxyribose-phosphate aldolase [Oceanomicrobium pacificus]